MSKKRRDNYYSQEEESYSEDMDFSNFTDSDDDLLPEQRDNRWELEENEIVAELRKDLRPLLSSEGLNNVCVWLRVSLNRHLALSNLEKKEINSICKNLCITLNKMLVQNSRKWGLTTDASRSQVKNIIKELIFVHLNRAYKDGERRYRSATYRGVGNKEEKQANSSSLGGLFSRKAEKRRTNAGQREIDYDDDDIIDNDEVSV